MNIALVSVVMATYAGDNFEHLKIAIGSILNQSYPNIELLIICDGPVDSERINYFSHLPDVVNVLYHVENSGPAVARNIGIEMAAGDYIAIMDADDISLPSRILSQLNFVISRNLDLISSDLLIIDSDGVITGTRQIPHDHDQIRKVAPLRCPMHNPSAFGKASLFKNLKYNPHLRVSEDYELWVRALIDGYRLGNDEIPLVQYRQSSAAIYKRVGFKYAKGDLLVKCKALYLSPFWLRPFYFVIACCASLIRLMPPVLFYAIYRCRSKSLK
jgi:glycosyltransferase involved in cell wall biosynthesis